MIYIERERERERDTHTHTHAHTDTHAPQYMEKQPSGIDTHTLPRSLSLSLQEKCAHDITKQKNDGIFWISLIDFMRNYGTLYICRSFNQPDWFHADKIEVCVCLVCVSLS